MIIVVETAVNSFGKSQESRTKIQDRTFRIKTQEPLRAKKEV
jgi:hypothetical protein